jgi:hypothetical protein
MIFQFGIYCKNCAAAAAAAAALLISVCHQCCDFFTILIHCIIDYVQNTQKENMPGILQVMPVPGQTNIHAQVIPAISTTSAV